MRKSNENENETIIDFDHVKNHIQMKHVSILNNIGMPLERYIEQTESTEY